jgi:hypothetical protein
MKKTYARTVRKVAFGLYGRVPKKRNYERGDNTCLLVLRCITNSDWCPNLKKKQI